IWLATQADHAERMLDLARVGARDYVIDLGSGDGVLVITAAKRGARGLGIEYDAGLVELSKRNARQAGVAERVSFVKEDLFQSDFSKATVLAMYLTPEMYKKLTPKLLAMPAGTRIVSNTFQIPDWPVDDSATTFELRTLADPIIEWFKGLFPDWKHKARTDHCFFYCKAFLWIVPARVEGKWR